MERISFTASNEIDLISRGRSAMPPCHPTTDVADEDVASLDGRFGAARAAGGRLDWSASGRETKAVGRPDAGARSEPAASLRRALAGDVLERGRREIQRQDEDVAPPPPPPLPVDVAGSFRAPTSFYCPLTMAVMTDPVQDREGNSYEKDAIEQWLASHETSPITRNRLRKRHLVPNRALKEAIDHERRRNDARAETVNGGPRDREAAPAVPARAPASAAAATPRALTTHQETINAFLASLNVKSRLDRFGIALLPMKKLRPAANEEPIDMVMVIEAPPEKETFRLYTHFAGRIDRSGAESAMPKRRNATSRNGTTSALDHADCGNANNSDKAFDNLLKHGRHKSLTLQRVCAERVRFGFEGRGSEVGGCSAKLRAILDMFVRVSVRMRKRIEG